jgi:polysaccharide deacetylase family protein (PEP-CTERM system associated)
LFGLIDLENILCVDVEGWYHPEYVKRKVSKNKEERIIQSLKITFQLLSQYDVNATFFIVGELVEKYPEMIEIIGEKGYELGFHGYYHEPLWALSADAFRRQVMKFNSKVQSITGGKCSGFRAPSASLDNRTLWALDILEENGYLYDSSVFPSKTPLYGVPTAPIFPYHPSSRNIADRDEDRRLIEFPALVYPVLGLRIPTGGGFYLRLLPPSVLKKAVDKMNKRGFPAVLSFHTWEVDPDTPRMRLGLIKSFITYYNLNATREKMKFLLSKFQFVSFKEYLEKHGLI